MIACMRACRKVFLYQQTEERKVWDRHVMLKQYEARRVTTDKHARVRASSEKGRPATASRTGQTKAKHPMFAVE